MNILKENSKRNLFDKKTYNDLINNELKVAAYVRVSTDYDEQKSSFISQQKYYMDKICNNSNWSFVDIYFDEGKSGTDIYKRTGFKKMIRDGLNGKYDYILTKSISRFARNTVDTLEFIRLLRDKGIGTYFEEENINTLDMNGELLLSILGSIAQQEVLNLSSHVILGLQMKAKQGKIIGSTSCYGYDYDNVTKNFVINPETSIVVKKIFNLYLSGYGTKKIADILTKEKIKTATGNDVWNEGSITHILFCEKYSGDLLSCKYISSDPISKKMKRNDGERDMYYIKNHHPAIIDRDIFEKVKQEREKRAKPFKKDDGYNYNKKYPYSGKLFCGFCNRLLKRVKTNASNKPKYYCNNRLKGYLNFCKNGKMIDEEIIKKSFMQAVRKLKRKIVNEDKFSREVKSKLMYARKIVMFMDKLEDSKFDSELFKSIIKYVLLGYEENGNINPFCLRYILNSEEDIIFKNKKINSNNLYKLFEFTSNQLLVYFNKDKYGKLHRVIETKIQVRVEIDLGDDYGD